MINHHLIFEITSASMGVFNTILVGVILFVLFRMMRANILLNTRVDKVSLDTSMLIVDKQKNAQLEFEKTIDDIYNRVLEKINMFKLDSDKLMAFISKKYEILNNAAKTLVQKNANMTKEEYKGFRTNNLGKHIYILELKRQWLGEPFANFTTVEDDIKLQRVLDKIENILFSPTNNKVERIKVELIDYITDVLNILVATWNKFREIEVPDSSKIIEYTRLYSANRLNILFKVLLSDVPMYNESYDELLSLCSQYNGNEKGFTLGTIKDDIYEEHTNHIKERLLNIINKIDEQYRTGTDTRQGY